MGEPGVMLGNAMKGLCSDCTILSGFTYPTHADGTRAQISTSVYNHHIIIAAAGKPSVPLTSCKALGALNSLGDGTIPLTTFLSADNAEATDTVFTTADGKFNSGFYVSPSTRMMLTGMLVNYNPEPMDVYVNLEIEYVPGKPPQLADASNALISVGGCKGVNFTPKPNSQETLKSEAYNMPQDGYIINAYGHLHDGGVNTKLFVNGNMVCVSEATYGTQGAATEVNGEKWETISKMSTCPGPFPIKKGDVVTMTSDYDTQLHPL